MLTSSIRTLLPAPLLSASSIKGFCFFFSGSSGVGVNEEREFLGFAAPLLSLVVLGPGPPPKQQDGVQHRKVLFDFFVAFLFVVVVALAFSKEFAAAHMISHDIHPAPALERC